MINLCHKHKNESLNMHKKHKERYIYIKNNSQKQFHQIRKDIYTDLLPPSSGLLPRIFFLYMVSCCFFISFVYFCLKSSISSQDTVLFFCLVFCFIYVSVMSATFTFKFELEKD